MIDAHHHLWDLSAVSYPWLEAQGVSRFFGDPTPIQRNYLIDEFCAEASSVGVRASVHIQVGAADPMAEARWVQSVAESQPDWQMAQVVFCDLTAPDLGIRLDDIQKLSTVRGVRQIVGRAPEEDSVTGTNDLLDNPAFVAGLKEAGARGLSFDLQLIPELMEKTARVMEQASDTKIALSHSGSPHDRSREGLAQWAAAMKNLSALPNVHCKLSGLGMFEHDWTTKSIKPIVDEVLAQFGSDRLMYGSNFPVDKLYSDYDRLMTAFKELVPISDHPSVFTNTALRFYDLDDV